MKYLLYLALILQTVFFLFMLYLRLEDGTLVGLQARITAVLVFIDLLPYLIILDYVPIGISLFCLIKKKFILLSSIVMIFAIFNIIMNRLWWWYLVPG